MMAETFRDFLVERVGPRWCIAARLTPNLRAKGHKHAISQQRFKALEEEWERTCYGATLPAIEAAAPDLYRALRLLVRGEAPDGLGSQGSAEELLQLVERNAIKPHYQRAASLECAAYERAQADV